MSNAFDTLKYTKRAGQAGMSPSIAEFQANEIAKVYETQRKATIGLRNEIRALRFDLRLLENRLVWRFFGGMATLLTIFHFWR